MSSLILDIIASNQENSCSAIGCLFLRTGRVHDIKLLRYKKLVKFYGGKNQMKIIADQIRKENDIFKLACEEACIMLDIGKQDLLLLDLLKTFVPSFAYALNPLELKPLKSVYKNIVWQLYVEKEGNFNNVLYGFIEYLCTICNPWDNLIQDSMEKILSKTMLRTIVKCSKMYVCILPADT